MQTIKIFLASSPELDADKEQVELFISRKNKDYQEKMIFLELSTLKDFISAKTEEHSQDKYNQYIRSCDITVFLFYTRLFWIREKIENWFDEYTDHVLMTKSINPKGVKHGSVELNNIDGEGKRNHSVQVSKFMDAWQDSGKLYSNSNNSKK